MKNYSKHLILLFALLLYTGLWIVLHPYLGYLLDSDGVAYLTIAKRVARAQYFESINGLWSPLNSWLLVPFIQNGLDAWIIAKVLNCFFGATVLTQVHMLISHFKMRRFDHTILMFAAAIVMVHNVYLQMFGDVLQLIFVLIYLHLIFSKQFLISYWQTALCGIVMAIGFYAKAYSLLFFFLHFAIILFWHYKTQSFRLSSVIKHYVLAFSVSLLLVLPWTYALHQKYHIWSLTGVAGKLNMSWQINSGKSFRSDIDLLVPPTYNDSPSFWEDPFPSQHDLSSPFSSPKHFIKWIARIAHTTLIAVSCYNEISFLALAILLISMYFFFFAKQNVYEGRDLLHIQVLILTICILPLGYLMMHIETRYIWLNIFLLMIVGTKLLANFKKFASEKWILFASLLFAFSFIVFPILNIENLRFKNKDLFLFAHDLKSNHIHGSFSSNAIDGGRMWVVAYLTNNPFFTIERTDYSMQELMTELKRYKVKYFLYESVNNKPSINLDSKYFTFLFKGDGFDFYQINSN